MRLIQDRPFRQIGRSDETPPRDGRRADFARDRRFATRSAQTLLDDPHPGDELFQFMRFERRGVIGTGQGSIQREVFFDDTRAARDCRETRLQTERVVGVTDGNLKCRC